MQQKPSMIKILAFILAIFANLNYGWFILNPAHADNMGFWLITVMADSIAVFIFLSTWTVALWFEVSKPRYYREIAELRKAGKYLLRQKVAVLVTVVNEDLSIVRNTLACAKSLIGEKQIYLLDDGRKPETQQLAAEMGVRYIIRGNNAFYKAGNLNNALRYHVEEDFFIVVDADFALYPDFIQQTLPLFVDPRVAAVQTPQVYSNEDTLFARGFQHLQDIFYSYLQPGKHMLNASFCVGTNVICRKRAFHDVGGFAEVLHSEDVFTTLKLLERGYKVAFLNETLAVGTSPTTLISFYNQQYRWARGGLTMMLKHNTLFNSKLHPEQRLQFFISNFFYLSGISVLIYLLSPLIAILLNVKPLNDAYLWQWFTAYVPLFCANFLFAMSLLKKHRLQSLVLGMFTFVPYLNALRSVLFSMRAFRWTVTGAKSKGLITKLLAPYILLLAIAIAIGYFLATGILSYNPALTLYYLWLAVDIIVVFICIISGYAANKEPTIPVFQQHDKLNISTAEILAVSQPTEQIAAVRVNQFARMIDHNGHVSNGKH